MDAEQRPVTSGKGSAARIAASGFVITGLGSIANLIFLIGAIRRFGASEAGVIVVAVAAQVLLLRLSDMGSMGAIVRFISMSRFGDRSDRGTSPTGVIRLGLGPVIALGALGGALVFGFADGLAELVNPDEAAEMERALRAVAVGAPIFVMYMNLVHSLKGFEAFGAFRLIERLGRPALYLSALAFSSADDGAATVVVLVQVAHLVCLVAAVVVLQRVASMSADGRPHGRQLTMSEFWRFAAPQGVSGVLDGMLAWSDTILISTILSSSSAATYTAVARVLLVHSFSVDAAAEVGAPRFSAAISRGDRPSIRQTYRELVTFQTGLVVPIALVLIVWLPEIVELADDQLVDGVSAARIILVGAVVAAAIGPSTILLLMQGRSGLVLVGSFLALVMNLGLNVALLPTIGVMGAGVAWAAALVVGTGWAFALTRDLHDLGPADYRTTTVHLAVAGFGAALIARLVAPESMHPALSILFLVGAVVLAGRSLLLSRRT